MQSIVKTNPNQEFKVIDLSKEYSGATAYTGKERFAIVTDLSEEELSKFSYVLEPYKPYVVISVEMFNAMAENNANDKREQWRNCMLHDAFSPESLLLMLDATSDPIKYSESIYNLEYITARMLELPDNQGSRLFKRYVLGYTVKEIALSEGIDERSVQISIKKAKEKIHKAFVECGVAV